MTQGSAQRDDRGSRRATANSPAVRPADKPDGTPAERPEREATGQVAHELRVPDATAVLRAVVRFGTEMSPDMHEDEIVYAFVDALSALFPGRLFAVRLFASGTGELSTVYATGRLLPTGRDTILLSRDAIDKYGLDLEKCGQINAQPVARYVPLFEGAVDGFDIPLTDGETLMGILSAEYLQTANPSKQDREFTASLVTHLAGVLKTARFYKRSLSPRELSIKFLDNASIPILVLGTDGRVDFANRAFLGASSLRLDEILGQDWLSMLPETERQRLVPGYLSALRGGATSHVEINLPRKRGSPAHLSAMAGSVLTADGEVEGLIYIFRDGSTENPAALRQLVAGVVHELNNPLTNISVYGEYLRKKGEKAGADLGDLEKLRRIVASCDRIRNFTRDLVAYSTPSNEKPRLTSINEILDQAVVYCEHLLEETGATIERRYRGDLPRVYAVKSQLIQVFVNLITNACHAVPKDAGGVVLETSSHGAGDLKVRVIDTGSGIPQDNLERIFEPFFTTKGQGQGTGLGLSIIRNIVEHHRGTIAVASEVGSGTTFEVILPGGGLTKAK